MKNDASWGSALKIAWREARASAGKFAFVILAVSAGVGALTGVRGFSGSFRDMLLRDARTLMAADLSVRLFNETSPETLPRPNPVDKPTQIGLPVAASRSMPFSPEIGTGCRPAVQR